MTEQEKDTRINSLRKELDYMFRVKREAKKLRKTQKVIRRALQKELNDLLSPI